MRKRMLFVYNPRAGKAQIRSNLLDIIDIFVKAGYEVTAYPTQATGDAVKAVKERQGSYDMVACCGGDGTLDEVVNGMMQSEEKLPVGYIPAGSTNDFANSLKIPKNMIKAADVVVNGVNYACDIGRFNNDNFIYVAAFGIFTDVSYGTKQDVKNVLGHAAYLLEGVKRLPSVRACPLKITCNDQVIEGEFLYGMVTNSYSVGGFRGITGQDILLDDGLFEVTLIKTPKNPMELNSILAALAIQNIDTQYMYSFKSGRLVIESGEEIAWTLDGEFGGTHKEVTLTNEKQAMDIMVKE